jgi:aspartate aminotransferase
LRTSNVPLNFKGFQNFLGDDFMLADRILSVERSPFYSIMELAAQRDDCIYMNLGEPDFVTPKHVAEAAKKALDEGHTHYGPDRGAPELRQLIVKKIEKEYGAKYDWEDEILITAGGRSGGPPYLGHGLGKSWR